MKKLNTIMGVIAGSTVGLFIIHTLWVRWHYYAHPDIHIVTSAPWYTVLLLTGPLTVLALAGELIIYLLLRRHFKRRDK